MKNFIESNKKYILGAFVLAETAIYLAFLIPQIISGGEYLILKYSGILLCLLTSAVTVPAYGKDGAVVTLALFFTAISDLFLFVINDFIEIGVGTFIIVQLIYFARINLTHGKKPYISAGLRILAIAATLTALGVTGNLSPLVVLAAIYFPMLVCNAAESVLLFKISKKYIIFFIGLTLFIGCDICVGLHNFAALGIALPAGVKTFVSTAIWAFYLPSQVLIVLSARKTEYKLFFKKDGGEGVIEK